MTDLNTNNDEKAKLEEELNESAADHDDPKAKFLNGGKTIDDSQVVVEVSSGDESFTGLGKEELMQYANDPFWKKVRLILFILFWVGWIAMLVAAIVIIVLAPRCPYRPDQKWYEKNAVYQAYPKSFKDSSETEGDGAGIGDLKGLISKLGYIKSLGTKALYINSFYKSGDLDNGLDVVDHTEIDPIMGTMEEFASLRKQTKTDMRLILDFIPNHTSKKHPWFVGSQKGEANKYNDYYIWKNCNETNNWLSVYGGSAWTKDTVRGQCYYHTYLPDEPDLNLNNEEVTKELEDILRFWLGKGVDGFNIVGAQYLTEDPSFNDEPSSGTGSAGDYNSLDHKYTAHQNGSLQLIKYWRGILDSYATKPGKEKMLLVSVGADANTTKLYYANGANIVTETLSTSNAQDILSVIEAASEDPTHRRGWMLSNQDSSRIATVVTKTKVKAMMALQMLLPGTSINYYGNEIGMEDGVVSFSQTKDPIGIKKGYLDYQEVSRDPFRTPMLWTPSNKAGFTKEKFVPWLPITNPGATNVESQEAKFRKHDDLSVFKQLVTLRGEESFQWGIVKAGVVANDVVWFTRKAEGFPGYLVVMNLGSSDITSKFYDIADIPPAVDVAFHSSVDSGDSIELDKQAVYLPKDTVIAFKYSK